MAPIAGSGFNIELGQFFQKPAVCSFLQPPPPAVTVDKNHEVIPEFDSYSYIGRHIENPRCFRAMTYGAGA